MKNPVAIARVNLALEYLNAAAEADSALYGCKEWMKAGWELRKLKATVEEDKQQLKLMIESEAAA